MAYAAYRESHAYRFSSPGPSPRVKWRVLDVTVPSGDALVLRRALARCPDTGVLRCIPLLDEKRVRLEVKLPGAQLEDVMHCIMVCVPSGELGTLSSWRAHMLRHGLTHGG